MALAPDTALDDELVIDLDDATISLPLSRVLVALRDKMRRAECRAHDQRFGVDGSALHVRLVER